MKPRLYMLIILALLTAGLLLACGGGDEETEPQSQTEPAEASAAPTDTTVPGDYVVEMELSTFNPQSLTVSPGTEVTWVNKDDFEHTVRSGTSENPGDYIASGSIPPGDSFSFTFDSVGAYDYYCEVHTRQMQGVVIVEEDTITKGGEH